MSLVCIVLSLVKSSISFFLLNLGIGEVLLVAVIGLHLEYTMRGYVELRVDLCRIEASR